MDNEEQLIEKIWNTTADTFVDTALELFRFQYQYNSFYRNYCNLLKKIPENIHSISAIPFLPIQFFKRKQIKTTPFTEALYFESSGTTGAVNSRHFVKDITVYEKSFMATFAANYGNVKNICIIGLLPSYLERQHSSLVYMVNTLINLSGNNNSGFYLYDYEKLKTILLQNEAEKKQTILFGVTYALLDFAEANNMNLKNTIIMETGGMKGRRKELSRTKVHEIIMNRLGVAFVHSEYGMTELLSQAYSVKEGVFSCPPWMKVLVRKEDDPFEIAEMPHHQKTFVAGAVNVIDLANLYSCAFIATDDAGKIYSDGSFEITGRLDNSDIRGCGLMIL